MLYLIAGISFVVFGGLLFLYRFADQKGFCLRAFFRKLFFNFFNLFKKEKKEYVEKEYKRVEYATFKKVIAITAIVLFFVRYMSFREIQLLGTQEAIYDFSKAGAGPSSYSLNQFGNVLIWFEIFAFLTIVAEPFFDSKITKFISLYVATPFIVLCFAGMPYMMLMMRGDLEVCFTFVLFGLEIGSLLAITAMNWVANWRTKFYRPTIIKGIVTSVVFLLFTVPTYLPVSLFGYASPVWHVKELSMTHRLFIYFFIVIPPLPLYFFLRNQSKPFIRYTLLTITTGVMILFVAFTKYDAFTEPWRWPLHLCNTVVFVMPICFIFKTKRLFYFTYFINVFGAVFAILMPNTSLTTNLMDPDVFRYWYDHAIAFWMPLLAVALKVFEKPKLKQYFFSTIWFTLYFIFVMVLNTVFSAYAWQPFTMHHIYDGTHFGWFERWHYATGTDFFFANSDFLPNKLGEAGKKVFKMVYTFNLPNAPRVAVIYPPFQIIYYVTYVLLGFGVWFIYVLFFKISDEHYALHLKLRAIRADRLALESKMDGRSLQEPMEKNAGISYKLIDFSKRYAGRKVFAVEHANLEVHGGEIFGFLGPNGAGKSTIIKSIVGIQPITQGKIYVCGYDVKLQPVFAKNIIGFVPDHYALYEKLTGREYLNYIADIYEVSQEDRDTRLKEYIHLFDLESSIDNKIKTYSHGMKQKITIISALVHEPKVWILDEPLTGLDPNSIYQVKECMKKHAAKGNIVFFSSHLIDIVEKLCDRIAIIKKGHIQCITKVDEIEKTGMSLEDFYMSVISKKEENNE